MCFVAFCFSIDHILTIKSRYYLMRAISYLCQPSPSHHSPLSLCLSLPLTFSLSLPPSSDEGVWDSFIRLIPPSSRSVTVPLERLRSGISYEFRVIAINRYGYGQPSAPTAALAGNYTWLHEQDYTWMQIRPIDKAFLVTLKLFWKYGAALLPSIGSVVKVQQSYCPHRKRHQLIHI